MTLKHLEIFIKVCKHLNMTKAAVELNMTQPAVTRSIKELEQYYNVKLFERLNKRIYLTETGKTVYAQAVHIIANYQEMEENLFSQGENRILRIGSNFKTGSSLLPGLIADFKHEKPALEIRVKVFNHSRLERMICDNELDLAFVEGLASHPDIHYEKLGEEKLMLVLSPDHPLNKLSVISMADLIDQNMLVREEGSNARRFLDMIFASHSLHLNPAWESASVETLVQAAVKGLGVAILPKILVSSRLEDRSLVARTLSDEDFVQDQYIIWHKNKYLTESAQDFIRFSARHYQFS